MSTTKKIYFLSAIVLIIGCFALNLSYSLFVQTEEKSVVNASVPKLAFALENDTFTIPANSGQLIILKVNNTGADMNFGVSIPTLPEGIYAQLVDKEGNDIIGVKSGDADTSLKTNESKEIMLYITNENSIETDVSFNLTTNYNTLDFDTETLITNSNIDCVNKYKITLGDTILYLDDRIVKNTTTPTFTGVETNEVGMYKTPDDYGDSWYFRGAQHYNYVNFAGFTWRIVRINGDGSIRLILDGTLDKVYRKNEDGTTSTKVAGKTSYFNSNTQYNAYIGYMFGETKASDYDTTHQNTKDSAVKEVIDLFYETYIENDANDYHYEKYLADTLFCGDKTMADTDIGSSNTGKGYNSYSTSYAAQGRLEYSNGVSLTSNASPTLECAKGATNTYSRYTANSTSTTKGVSVNNNLNYPIALLSADELVMAGAWVGWGTKTNTSYYLYANEETAYSWWWTMTPRLHSSSKSWIYLSSSASASTSSHSISYLATNASNNGVRPVLNLKAEVMINSGKGTYEEPYTIKEITE